MQKIFIILSFIFSNWAFAQQRPSCDVEQILRAHQNSLGTTQARIPLSDGSSFINPFYSGTRTDNDYDLPIMGVIGSDEDQGISQQPQQEVQTPLTIPRTSQQADRLFNETRDLMIAQISGQSDIPGEQQSLMIERLRQLKLNINDNCNVLAFNSLPAQVISMCDRTLRLPTLSLVSILAHEIGHSIDLCNLGCPRYHRNQTRTPMAEHLRTQSPNQDAKNFFSQVDQFQGSTSLILKNPPPGVEQQMNLLVERGVYRLAEQGIALENNPARQAYRCLSQAGSHYRPLPSDQAGVCQGSDFSEASAQIWSARAVADYIKAHPPQNLNDRLGLFAAAELDIMTSKGSRKITDYNQIFLSEPSIRRMFNCEPQPQQNCMERFLPSSMTDTPILPINTSPSVE